MAQLFTARGLHWAVAGGNHDEEGDLTRAQVSEVDRSYPNSLTQPNPGNITHVFNYHLEIFDNKGQNVTTRLWFLDTGREDCLKQLRWGCVHPDQVEWFREEHFKIAASDPSKGRGILFTHIPLPEYLDLWNNAGIAGTKGEGVACGAVNTGVFAALKEQPAVEWVTCGHDHDNDYWGIYQGVNLAFGRKTGYGSYGPDGFLRGARVFEFT